ncbi:MAG: SMP-30/gluconolactonase/LRE family protein [Ilumatobacter sp.]
MDIERIDGPIAELGEGPLWDHRRQCLWWVDIVASTLHRYDPASGVTDSVMCSEPFLSMVVPSADGGLVVATEEGIGSIDPSTGIVTRLGDASPGSGLRMNDGNVGPDGRLWVGSMHHDFIEGAASLFVVGADGRAATVLDDVTCSNGIGWSPDGSTMFYVDTFTTHLDAFDIDASTGAVSNRRAVVEFDPSCGGPDGIAVDADGAVWVALWDGAAVHRYLPDGTLDRVVEMPVSRPTCPEFGGVDLDVLYVTAAADDAAPGGLFRIEGLGVAGVAATPFGGEV